MLQFVIQFSNMHRFSSLALRLAREGGARVSRVACEALGALLSSPALRDRPEMSELRCDIERNLIAQLLALGPTPDRFLSTLHRLHKYFPQVLELDDSRYVFAMSVLSQLHIVLSTSRLSIFYTLFSTRNTLP